MDCASDSKHLENLYSSDPRIALKAWQQYADRNLTVISEIEQAIATNSNFKAIAFTLRRDCRESGRDSPDWFAIICYIASGVYRIDEAKASSETNTCDHLWQLIYSGEPIILGSLEDCLDRLENLVKSPSTDADGLYSAYANIEVIRRDGRFERGNWKVYKQD